MMWLHVEGCFVGVTKMHEGCMLEVRQKMQLKSVQVTCGMLQKIPI